MLFELGARLMRTVVSYDEGGEQFLTEDGIRPAPNPAKFQEKWRRLEPQAPTDRFILALQTGAFEEALKLVTLDQVDLSTVEIDDESLSGLVGESDSKAARKLVDRLVRGGLFRRRGSEGGEAHLWYDLIACGNVEATKSALELGLDLCSEEDDGEPLLHAVAMVDGQEGEPMAALVIEHVEDLNGHHHERGTLLWAAHDERLNVRGARRLYKAGARARPPTGAYDGLSHEAQVKLAARHGDLETLERLEPTPSGQDAPLRIAYWALQAQAMHVLEWLEGETEIDWMAKPGFSDPDMILPPELPLWDSATALLHRHGLEPELALWLTERVGQDSTAGQILFVRLSGVADAIPALDRLLAVGADPSAAVAAEPDCDQKSYGIYEALLHHQLDTFEWLLEKGAQIPPGLPLTIEIGEYLRDYFGPRSGADPEDAQRVMDIAQRFGIEVAAVRPTDRDESDLFDPSDTIYLPEEPVTVRATLLDYTAGENMYGSYYVLKLATDAGEVFFYRGKSAKLTNLVTDEFDKTCEFSATFESGQLGGGQVSFAKRPTKIKLFPPVGPS